MLRSALITGASGFLGSALAKSCDTPLRTSRTSKGTRTIAWKPEAQVLPAAALEGVEVVFHLAGESVADGRWTDEKKRRIRESRILGTRNLVAGIRAATKRPKLLICASAVGYYGDRGDTLLDESSSRGEGFLAEVCEDWEAEAATATALGLRVVCVRTGLVLSTDGGALPRMLTPFRLGLGGRLGSGEQWMPWIHLDDMLGLLHHAYRDQSIVGPLAAVAPNPERNRDFTRLLGKALRRPTVFAVPGAALRFALGELAQLLMSSQRVHPSTALRTNYSFRYPTLEEALAALKL